MKKPMKMKKAAPAKMGHKKSPAKKPLVGKQKNLPEELKKKILASPAQMKKAAMKLKKEEGAAMKMKKAAMKLKKDSTMMMKKAAMKMKSAMKMKKAVMKRKKK